MSWYLINPVSVGNFRFIIINNTQFLLLFKEIKMSEGYSNIKMFKTNHAKSNVEQEDLTNGGWDRWYNPKNATALAEFSAVCFLAAR